MWARETSVEPAELRRKFDEDEDEFEDDGFTFDDEDEEDELIEITPANVRLRKRMLAAVDRKKSARAAARIADAS